MKRNSLFLLVGALILATGVALLARTLLAPPKPAVVAKAEAPPPPAPPRAAILVAAHDLAPGDFIDAATVDWREVDEKPARNMFFLRDSDRPEQLFGATVRRTVQAGQALTVGIVVRPGEPGFVAAVLQPGMRAVSIPTSRLESSYGLVSSGDRVDVILGLKRDDPVNATAQGAGTPHLAAQTILRDVRILALNNQVRSDLRLRPDDDKGKDQDKRSSTHFETVMVEVTPQEAEKLAVAKEIGTLQLALRPARADVEEELYDGGVTTLRGTTDVYASTMSSGSGGASVQAFRGNSIETISLGGK